MRSRIESLFIASAAAMLMVTGLAKTLSLLTANPRLLESMDPFFAETFRLKHVLLVAAGCEFLVFLLLISARIQALWKFAAIAWLSTIFLSYRLGLVLSGVKGPCKCLGTLWQKIPIMSAQQLDIIMQCMLGYLIIGAYSLLLLQLLKGKDRTEMHPGRELGTCSV